MQRGERVLIHSGTGGVGLAAVQLALKAEAIVFATAGSPRSGNCSRALGVPHVMDSRSLAFADEVLKLTEGEGVDVVLNSLSGEAIDKSLSILRPFGRFIEIGKTDIYKRPQDRNAVAAQEHLRVCRGSARRARSGGRTSLVQCCATCWRGWTARAFARCRIACFQSHGPRTHSATWRRRSTSASLSSR